MADPAYYQGDAIDQPAGSAPPAAPAAAPAGAAYYQGDAIDQPAPKVVPPPSAKPDVTGASSWGDDLRALSEGAASGRTFGLSDIAGAAGAATGSWLRRELPPPDWLRATPGAPPAADSGSWVGDFRDRLAEYRADAAQHPYANLAGALVGAAAVGGPSAMNVPRPLGGVPAASSALDPALANTAPAVTSMTAPPLLRQLATGAATGAGAGAASGWAGSSDPLSPGGAWDAAKGGVLGAGVGAALPLAGPIARNAPAAVADVVPHGAAMGLGALGQYLTGYGGGEGLLGPFVGEKLAPGISRLWETTQLPRLARQLAASPSWPSHGLQAALAGAVPAAVGSGLPGVPLWSPTGGASP